MIWIDCNPQVGREMKDRHPLMVLSPREFNDRTGIVIGQLTPVEFKQRLSQTTNPEPAIS